MLKEIKNQSKVIGYASDSGIVCGLSQSVENFLGELIMRRRIK